jgi:hypothetical protein
MIYLELQIEEAKNLHTQKLLEHIYRNKKTCSSCISNISSFSTIQHTLVVEKHQQKLKSITKCFKSAFNCLSMSNSTIMFVIFDGPKVINGLMLINLLLIGISIFYDAISLYLESFVIFISIATYLRCSHVLVVNGNAVVRNNNIRRD